MITTRLIMSPCEDTREIIKSRMSKRSRGASEKSEGETNMDAIGLIEGTVIEMIAASDIAGKAASVQMAELTGLCPQHFTSLVLFGDIESVTAAVGAVTKELGQEWLKKTGQ